MKYLLVDLNVEFDGHKFGFLQQAIRFLENNASREHSFYVASNLPAGSIALEKSAFFHYAAAFRPEGLQKYREQWKWISQVAIENSIDKVVLLELDRYQEAIGRFRMGNFGIYGIWFRPYLRQQRLDTGRLSYFLQALKKRASLWYALRNTSLEKVLILNDQQTVDAMNASYPGRFAYLADPVFDFGFAADLPISQKFQVKNGNTVFLLFGCIDARKNVQNTLKAFALLDKKVQEKVTLLIVGKVMDKHVERCLDSLETPLHIQLIVEDRFVDDEEMESFFAACDVVLRMNVNFFASSGIIGIAAKYNKPSIVSNYGVVADLTLQYGLGKLVDPMDVRAIADLFQYYIENPKQIDGKAYVEKHNTAAYAKGLIQIMH